jgi:hypothetical protein
MLPRLMADGHEVAVLGLWGQQPGEIGVFDTPNGPVPIFPAGTMHYGLDVVGDQARKWLGENQGWVITLYDVWVLGNLFADQRVASWTPIDHYPITPGILKWAEKRPTIAMSRFGQRVLAEACTEKPEDHESAHVGVPSTYIPHGIEKFWKPSPSDVRKNMGVPDDAFLVMMNAANIGTPQLDRKAWAPNLRAFAEFARRHDDVFIYLHTDPTRMDGFPIPKFLAFLNLDESRTRLTDMFAYRAGIIPSETLADLYTAADVLLSCSMGEGFGLPVAESMACGTPAIVTDFSAQPEIVGEYGWKVDIEPWFDKAQFSEMALPLTGSILDALEEAYAEKGTGRARARSAGGEAHIRRQYDADTVYAEKWRPLLAQMEEQLHENPESAPAPEPAPRKAMSKSAKRRQAKAA